MFHDSQAFGEDGPVSDMFLLSESQMERIEPFFPLAHGVPRVDDRRVLGSVDKRSSQTGLDVIQSWSLQRPVDAW